MSAHGARNGMPAMPGRALTSATDAYVQRRTLWPLTFNSNAWLPTDGRIDATTPFRESSSRTTSPSRRTWYCCAAAGSDMPTHRTASTVTPVILSPHLAKHRNDSQRRRSIILPSARRIGGVMGSVHVEQSEQRQCHHHRRRHRGDSYAHHVVPPANHA